MSNNKQMKMMDTDNDGMVSHDEYMYMTYQRKCTAI